jgi:hypothetical protein
MATTAANKKDIDSILQAHWVLVPCMIQSRLSEKAICPWHSSAQDPAESLSVSLTSQRSPLHDVHMLVSFPKHCLQPKGQGTQLEFSLYSSCLQIGGRKKKKYTTYDRPARTTIRKTVEKNSRKRRLCVLESFTLSLSEEDTVDMVTAF